MTPSDTYAAVLDSVTDPVVVVRDGTVTYANTSFSELTDSVDPVGEPIRSFAPRDTAADVERFCDAVATGATVDDRARLVFAGDGGDRRLVTVDATRIGSDDDGHATALVVVDSLETDSAWTHQERILDALPVGVFRARLTDGELLAANDELVALADADSKADLRGRDTEILYADPEAREAVADTLREDGVLQETEVELETLSGDTFWGSLSAVTDDLGDEVVIDGVVQDVTERRELETELRQRAEQFRRMFRRHSAPMLLVDPDTGGIRNANDAAAEFYGYSTGELAGMTVDDLNVMPPDELEAERERAEARERNHFLFEHELADGQMRTVEVHSSPIELEDDALLFSIVVDVTDRADYEQRLETQRDNLEVLNQVLRHDIRNDLQLVLAYAEMLAGEVADEQDDYVERILDSADHAVELTKTARDIADVMLTETDNNHPVALRSTLETELEEVRTSFPGAAVTVAGSIPDATVHGNDMLDSVFRNLLKNAVQHNDKPVPEVTVSAERNGDTATVRVADNGPGVPDPHKDAIFGKGETGLESDGTGMGLYLVETLVDAVGGDVSVADNDPEGAVFAVTLRVAD
ncbi:PAS domain S-box protein [Halobacterium jilantaiense]|uniref:histidine kinase n=1 Tax=Halobacterium jilantaiense TaxID=355548 RepID=A0A1I0MPB7_9EURY|nr:PAS domain S-box protein [Halobacterium jilantaiense]SEV90089.1 PAS domain S-box-containing protein [Halobacterium jilantaiense]